MTHTPSGNGDCRLCFIVESGTDVRLVEGLAERWPLTVLARRVLGGREISQATSAVFDHRVGPASFPRFGLWAAVTLAGERSAGVAGWRAFRLSCWCAVRPMRITAAAVRVGTGRSVVWSGWPSACSRS